MGSRSEVTPDEADPVPHDAGSGELGDPPYARAIRDHTRRTFAALKLRLARSAADRRTRFFNMGYRTVDSGPTDHSPLDLPPNMLNLDGARLVAELVGTVSLDGLAVLDIGCGRGGALWLFGRYFAPASLVGLDLSDDNVTFVKAAGSRVVHGDASRLPFADGRFDVVSNLESSGFYPTPLEFYADVRRCLRPEGRFLYGDCFLESQNGAINACLGALGFELELDRDISANVLASRAAVGDRHRDLLGGGGPEALFVGSPDSLTFEWLSRSTHTYRLKRLRVVGPPNRARAAEIAADAELGAVARELAGLTREWAEAAPLS